MPLPPWAEGPFELIFHAELHFRAGEDFDRRIAMIGFDNAIEVAITTYLSLHPMHRGGRTYADANVQQWLRNYHTRIEFFVAECGRRTLAVMIETGHIIWYHQIRNEQYHRGGNSTPTWPICGVFARPRCGSSQYSTMSPILKPYLPSASRPSAQRRRHSARNGSIASSTTPTDWSRSPVISTMPAKYCLASMPICIVRWAWSC